LQLEYYRQRASDGGLIFTEALLNQVSSQRLPIAIPFAVDDIDQPPEAARLANALSAVIAATSVDPIEALRAVREVGEEIEVPPGNTDAAFERVRLRSVGVENELREAEGGGLSDAQFAHSLGIKSRETIRKYREGRRIFGFRKGVRAYRYPAWQIHEGQLLPGLGEVIAILASKKRQPFSIISYFLTPTTDLNETRPLDLLRKGQVEEVVADAKRYGDIGT
jgi:hypothetical protein